MIQPSAEQNSIIDQQLAPMAVIACAGSGKTFTAVRRVRALRDLLDAGRGQIALLSFSNVAVDVFGRTFQDLKHGRKAGRSRVCIETFDGFITSMILRPHASRTMQSSCMPFLLTGTEPFLSNPLYQFKPAGKNFPGDLDKVEVSLVNGQPTVSCRVYSQTLAVPNGIQPVHRLGKLGAYTHSMGRYWAYETLRREPRILAALAHRYPQIVVDEAQDIGSMQVAFLELMSGAGSEITLIGDPNQAIFEFCGADGGYLRSYPTRGGVVSKELTINRRSVPKIVRVANSLASRNDQPFRSKPDTDHGAFFLPFAEGEESMLIAAFEAAVKAAGLKLGQSAVVCRATKKKQALRNLGQEYGQGVTKLFASATMARDIARDYDYAFRLTTYAVAGLLKKAPQQFSAGILDPSRFPQFRSIRKIMWEFTRDSSKGLPSGQLPMQSEWHPRLCTNVKTLLDVLSELHQLEGHDNLSMRLKKTGLPITAIAGSESNSIDAALRVETIHGVKGESLDAVLYLADRDHVKALVNGTATELGRIGYVAVTRARDLFWLGLVKSDAETYRTSLVAHGFEERQYDAQLDLPLSVFRVSDAR